MVFGELEVTADFKEKEKASAVIEALKPEFKASRRYKAIAQLKGGKVSLKVTAEDAVALRVATNFYLRHLTCLWNILNTLKSA